MLPKGQSTDNPVRCSADNYRFVVSSSQEKVIEVPDYHRFKACFDFKNQEKY